MRIFYLTILSMLPFFLSENLKGEGSVSDGGIVLNQLREVDIPESHSKSSQKARIWIPSNAPDTPIPLLVVLHTWSGSYRQDKFGGGTVPGMVTVMQECLKRGWAMVMPDFRGPNKRPEACASELAIRDVVDSVHYMKSVHNIDADRVYLYGVSGGGHMALMMASRNPELWNGVSSWVPISDLAAWHKQCLSSGHKYYRDLELVCGGRPGENEKVDREYYNRSPIHFLSRPKTSNVRIQINAGINDGHVGSVPVSHTLLAFNKLAEANNFPRNKVSPKLVDQIVNQQHVPEDFLHKGKKFSARKKKVLFFKRAGNASVTIFDGGHEGDVKGAFQFFEGKK